MFTGVILGIIVQVRTATQFQYEFQILRNTIYFVGMQRLVPAQMACFCFVVEGIRLVRYDLVFFCVLRPISCWHNLA